MADKLTAYELLGIFVPGVLLCAWIPICFPVAAALPTVQFPAAFSLIALTALAIFLGQLVQALASLLEPLIYWTWGGRPSDRALDAGLKHYFPADSAKRIRVKIAEAAGEESSDHSLFLFAMQRAEAGGNPRVRQFNTLYAYQRALLVLAILTGVMLGPSMAWGALAAWTVPQKAAAAILLVLLILLIWHRAWQRACYYVREVLLTAERVLDDRKTAKE